MCVMMLICCTIFLCSRLCNAFGSTVPTFPAAIKIQVTCNRLHLKPFCTPFQYQWPFQMQFTSAFSSGVPSTLLHLLLISTYAVAGSQLERPSSTLLYHPPIFPPIRNISSSRSVVTNPNWHPNMYFTGSHTL